MIKIKKNEIIKPESLLLEKFKKAIKFNNYRKKSILRIKDHFKK